MATAAQWFAGSRPRTLPAAFAPVIAGTGAAAAIDSVRPLRALLALGVAVALQVGVNFANDYSDGIRGTDDQRVGPFRLTGSGAAAATSVKRVAWAFFATAALAGLALIWLAQAWWLIVVGAASIVAAWYYTGGRNPYGYLGLGEVFAFVFFGLVAVLGTTFTQAGRVTLPAVAAAIGTGSLACAILVVNNLRDRSGDASSGKRTLAVRLGDTRTRVLYAGLLAVAGSSVPLAAVAHPTALLGLLAAPLAVRPLTMVLRGSDGPALLPVLGDTGRLELGYAVALAAGLAL
jgi:1,4-dihydroxy-2-naphthoate octaprenyltransferase